MDKFAFIIHPLTMDDFARKFSWMERVPDRILEKLTRRLPPFKVSNITGIRSITGKEIEGFFIACSLTSRQLQELSVPYVLEKIIYAGKKAEEMDAEILGLGSFTSVVGDKGITVAENLNIPVTTGNSYTVATAIQGTKKAVKEMEMDFQQETVTVIGATGSIGRAVSLLVSRFATSMNIVSRTKEDLIELKREIQKKRSGIDVKTTTNVSRALSNSRIVISASGSVNTLINPSDLLSGSVVCDVARPRDVGHRVVQHRNDVLVIDGGIVRVPGNVDFNFEFGCPPDSAFACMAETMILTFENVKEKFSLGPRLELEKVRRVEDWAQKHGFELSGLRTFEKILSRKKILEVKKRAKTVTVSG
ncbi:MAG: hypothetical protein ACLFT4_06270 [Bacteroidales bacterium]